MLERLFSLAERGTTPRREVVGGATTFATMAYIVIVNPAILSFAGLPTGPSTVATILVAVFGTLGMALYANRPIAVAPYMGENAFVAFGLAALGIAWPQMLGVVFVSGLLFLALTLFGVRSWLAEAISPYNDMLRQQALPGGGELTDPSALLELEGEVARQALMIGYVDVFYLCAITSVLAMPLIPLLRTAARASRPELSGEP